MKENDRLRAWAEVSRQIGAEVAYAQGGGGNTSLKLGPSEMAVKASGVRLREVTPSSGVCFLDYEKMRSALESFEPQAELFSGEMRAFSLSPRVRPSMEAPLHAWLGPCVVHTHSVLANLLCCSKEGEGLMEAWFPKAVRIPYASPGLPLARMLSSHVPKGASGVMFLLNHGLIVSEESPEAVLALHEEVNRTIQARLNLPSPRLESSGEAPSGVLFPDQAVYALSGLPETPAAKETLAAAEFLLETMPSLGLSPRFLPDEEVMRLSGLEAEAYRLRLSVRELKS